MEQESLAKWATEARREVQTEQHGQRHRSVAASNRRRDIRHVVKGPESEVRQFKILKFPCFSFLKSNVIINNVYLRVVMRISDTCKFLKAVPGTW